MIFYYYILCIICVLCIKYTFTRMHMYIIKLLHILYIRTCIHNIFSENFNGNTRNIFLYGCVLFMRFAI